ncbi:photosystem reaction center subunit H [Paenibacillus beijingensis]|uniref:Photosystem reaction center subunit H n=1 Tax=Paenibacillus beijingensis TaxID=1126833 RepID=A0A0D5NR66_9BACL|nr:photosystem reaction center subunit H [Paenibacillus beijingensis]
MKLQQMIGLPVIDSRKGKRLGTVKDAWFDEHWLLRGIVMEARGWFSKFVRAVLWDDVLTCGEDAVFIIGAGSIRSMRMTEIQRSFQSGCIRLKDLPVVTIEGIQLGRVSDVYFDPYRGTQIVGYELTDGFVADLMEGRKWLRAPEDPDVFMLGEDAIIVPAMNEADLEPVAASDP